MVFGFGKKKSSEGFASSAGEEKVVSLHDIFPILKELESPRLSRIIQEAKRIKDEIEVIRKNINSTIIDFEADDLNLNDVDKNLKTVVKRGKDAVMSIIKKETSSKLSSIEKYDNVLNYNVEVSQILKRMGDVLGLHTRVMHVFARKYADKLKEEISRLAHNRDVLQNLINEQENFKTQSEKIVELIRKIDVLDFENSQKNKRRIEIISEIDQTKTNITVLESLIAELRSKREYQEFLEIKKKMDLLSYEKNEIKNKIDGQFSKISRSLSKYTYVSAFEKPMKRLMEELVSDPYQVITSQNKSAIIEILEAAAKSVLAGNVSVKDSAKAMQQIEETINRLDEFLTLKEALLNRLSGLESNLRIFDEGFMELKEKDLLKAKLNLADLESSNKKLEKEIEGNKSHASTVKSEIESILRRLSNVKMTIKC